MKSLKNSKSSKNHLFANAGIFAAAALVASAAIYTFSPVTKTNADVLPAPKNTRVGFDVNPVINISTSTDDLVLEGPAGGFAQGYVNVDVSTNSQFGYTLTLEDADNNTDMVNTNENVDATVSSSYSGSKTSSTMDTNTWGFSINETDYYKIPVLGSPVSLNRVYTPLTSDYDRTRVDFGAKTSLTLTSGVYEDEVVFTAYVNGQDGKPVDDVTTDDSLLPVIISYMQDFSCEDLRTTGSSKTLTDRRDGSTYVVKKLADNKCWMTENLKIAGRTISDEDSNLPTGETFEIPSSAAEGGFTETNNNSVYVDPTYGGFYSFYTATAGWGSASAMTGSAPKDICPKGWHMPSNASTGEVAGLISNYNTVDALTDVPGFIHNGVMMGNDHLYYGTNAFYWTSTVYSTNNAYDLTFNDSTISTRNVVKYLGMGVRCVAD